MAINPLNPIGILINREVALRQKVAPSRATPLALTGSLLGSMSQSAFIGPIFTRHLAQREAIPVAPKPKRDRKDDKSGGLLSSSASSPERELEKVGARLKLVIDAAAARAAAAHEAARAAAEAEKDARQAYTETVKQAQGQFDRISAELEKLFEARNRSFSEKVAGVKETVGKILEDAHGHADELREPEAPKSGKYARVASHGRGKKSRADELISPHR